MPASIVESLPVQSTDITPSTLWKQVTARAVLRNTVRALKKADRVGNGASIAITRDAAARASSACGPQLAVPLVFATNVLCDMAAQGWTLDTTPRGIRARPPANGNAVLDEKARIRAAHLVERDAQLREPAVRRFVRTMERRRLHNGAWHSIFSLFRDGRSLASQLSSLRRCTDPVSVLDQIVDPYIQVATTGTRCEFTGLDLLDVWRYFRHTWTTTYQSTPGRKMFLLVRDRAAENHPVVGIAALGSPIVQLSVRDSWIGWTPTQIVEAIRSHPGPDWAAWLNSALEGLLLGIYLADFVKEKVLRRANLRTPTPAVVARLRRLAAKERETHRLYPARKQHKIAGRHPSEVDWVGQARTHLFRSKRAATLADLLQARLELQAARVDGPTSRAWTNGVLSAGVARAIAIILRQVKAAHVGIDMMDITVCGAVAPYNHLLGGKLVAMLMASPEVRKAYTRRYRDASSVIASSMAGRAVVRRPRLVLLGTTSLYGVGASQYNRIKIPVSTVGRRRDEALTYEVLGQTAGYGSYHFSRFTLDALQPLLGRLTRGRPVNSIFGEGVNPKFRKVRAALDVVGFPSDLLLRHGSPRLVYGVVLATNFRETLLGLQKAPAYILPHRPEATRHIVEFWRKRWLAPRIMREDVVASVANHSVAYPVSHGARVVLPEMASEAGPVFAQEQPLAEIDEDRAS